MCKTPDGMLIADDDASRVDRGIEARALALLKAGALQNFAQKNAGIGAGAQWS